MTERQQRAQELHGKGYNCAQSVACAYCDLVGLDEQTAYKMAEGFGLGMGVMDMCGALSGAFMLAGVKGSAGIEAPGTTKAQTYQQTREMANAFKEKNGTYLCCELKGVADGNVRRSCPGCIEDACAGREDARSVKSRTGKIKPLYLFRYSGFSYVYIQSIAAPTRPASLPSEARTSSVFVSPRKVSFSMRLRSGASSFSP